MFESQKTRDFPLFSSSRSPRGTKKKAVEHEVPSVPSALTEDLLIEIERAEGSVPLAKFVSEMLPKWLDLPQEFSPEIERAHRSLAMSPPERGPPRSVLMRFLRYPDKEAVLRAALQKRQVTLEGGYLRFYQDLSAEVLRRRREFSDLRKEFSDRQMYQGFAYPVKLRCVHKNQIHLFSMTEVAKDFLSSSGKDK